MKTAGENDPGALSREDVAQIEIGHTEISSRLARFLTLCFVAAIMLVPAAQHMHDFLQWRSGERLSPAPQAWDILRSARRAMGMWRWSTLPIKDRAFEVNRWLSREIDQYEDRLEEESVLTAKGLPLAQSVLSRTFGVGNEKVYVGQGNWLFYQPGIEYLTGPGFLSPAQLARRRASGNSWTTPPQPDPLKAIIQFHGQLAARGIDLILLPVPNKASVHAERIGHALTQDAPVLQNQSYPDFIGALKANGIRVFDPTDRLAGFARAHGAPAYLATDTHWTPAAMEHVAVALAEELRPLLPTAPAAAAFRRETAAVTNLGDLGKMLKLPSKSRWPAPETVEIHPVQRAAGSTKKVIDPAADVLLLGDSFANIYALESLGWGTSAGLAEHLALALNRPVDALRRNDAGAYATREPLARELNRGCNRLTGKKVVVWQFAARELAQGDWKLFDLKPNSGGGAPLCGAAGLRTLTGTHARMVWIQAVDPASTDPLGIGSGFRLMGIDSDDERGVREILPGPRSYRKPLLTPDGQHIVFTDFPSGRVGVVDWEGTNLRYVANGYAADVRKDADTGRTWVYAITGPINVDRSFAGKPLIRFDISSPMVRETVWDQTEVSLDNFQVSVDGRYAAGQFPWPKAGIADLRKGTWASIGDGCWTSLAPDKSQVAWAFDGAHRNLLFTDPVAQTTWKTPIHLAPGNGGFEVYHPRWGNHQRFFSLSGPYRGGEGDNRILAAGSEVEIYAGRFSADLRRVERWVKIVTDEQPDFFPDLWVDPARPPAFDPKDVEAAQVTAAVAAGPIIVDARLTAVTQTPTLRSIAPYRQALVVYAYDIVKVHQGIDPGPRILVHHWALRANRRVAPSTRVGDTVRLAIEPYDTHADLQGERVINDVEQQPGLPMFYEPQS